MKKTLLTCAITLLASLAALSQNPTPSPPSEPSLSRPSLDRAESERAIRASLYEVSLAMLTGDADQVRRRAAQRTLDFHDLLFAELSLIQRFRDQLRREGVKTGADFLNFTMRTVARQMASTPRERLEELARQQSAIPLTFLSDTEATGQNTSGTIRAVFERGEWRIDLTDPLRRYYLRTVHFSDESKARIERY